MAIRGTIVRPYLTANSRLSLVAFIGQTRSFYRLALNLHHQVRAGCLRCRVLVVYQHDFVKNVVNTVN